MRRQHQQTITTRFNIQNCFWCTDITTEFSSNIGHWRSLRENELLGQGRCCAMKILSLSSQFKYAYYSDVLFGINCGCLDVLSDTHIFTNTQHTGRDRREHHSDKILT